MQAKNYLDWINELESKVNIRNISSDLVAVSLAKDSLLNNIMELADREVDGTERCNVFQLFFRDLRSDVLPKRTVRCCKSNFLSPSVVVCSRNQSGQHSLH